MKNRERADLARARSVGGFAAGWSPTTSREGAPWQPSRQSESVSHFCSADVPDYSFKSPLTFNRTIIRLWPVRPTDPRKEKTIRRKAIEMVVRDGLDGFSMQRLARAARISPSTLYVYFDDRDDLIFQLFRDEMAQLTTHIMDGFAPGMSFVEGLRVQWKNRIRYTLEHPLQSDFLEHIRYSPYHERFMSRVPTGFFLAMREFVVGACQRGELVRLPVEVYWSIAFAPLYQLLKFQRSGFGLPRKSGGPRQAPFVLTDEVVDLALEIVARGLKPTAPVPFSSLPTFC